MKEKLLNRLGLKVVSLILAFVVWMAIVNISNPVKEVSYPVTVEVRNDEVMKANNLTYELVSKDTVTVNYMVRTRDESLIKPSDFTAYIDLKDYNVTGTVPVYIEVNKEKESLLVKSDEITTKPMVLRVKTEELQKKKFDLAISTEGKTEDGYVPGLVTLSPDYVIVEGPESQVGLIHHMGVVINVEGRNGDFEGSANPVFYDANGKELELRNKLTVNRPDIHYSMSVLKAKDLTLNFEVRGTVAEGYRFTGVECSMKSVHVAGTKSVLANLSTLSIADDKLNVEGATADKTLSLDLRDYLPPNTALADSNERNVEVTLKVEPLTTKIFSLDMEDVEKQGLVPEYEYAYDTEFVSVTVRGLKEDLDGLTEDDLNAVLDLTGLTPGTHKVNLSFGLEEGFEATGSTVIEVTITEEGETEEEEGPGETDGTGTPSGSKPSGEKETTSGSSEKSTES